MKIDVVYTWVNGTDPVWIQKKIARAKQVSNILPDADSNARFMDNQELKYSLRSLHQFAPWINKIFIVTDNQIPNWINLDNKKIRIVDHSEIFYDKTNLPTFSSQVIESQLHHIKELSEHFIYFNDDMFLGKFCKPDFFFTKEGLPLIYISEIFPIPQQKVFDIEKRPLLKRNTYQYTLVNTRKLIRSKLNRSVYFNIRHGIKPLLKSVLFEIENTFDQELKKISKNCFRTKDDVLMIYLFEFYAAIKKLGKTKYVKTVDTKNKFTDLLSAFYNKFTFGYINLHEEDITEHLERLEKSKPFTFCLNQTPETTNEHLIKTKNFLEEYYNTKSPFEI